MRPPQLDEPNASAPAASGASGGFPTFGVLSLLTLAALAYYGYARFLAPTADFTAQEQAAEAPSLAAAAESDLRELQAANARGRTQNDHAAQSPDRAADAVREPIDARPLSGAGAPPAQTTPVPTPAPTEAEVRDFLRSMNVVLYATSWCGYCRKAREFFALNGISYRELDVELDATAKQQKENLSPGGGVPVVVIEGTVIGGFNPQKYARAISLAFERQKSMPLQISFQQ